MEDPQMPGAVPPDPAYQTQASQPYNTVPPVGYTQSQYVPPNQAATPQALSDTAAGALAYVTIIPAIIFLVLPPYNTRPFVKFHSVQCLGLAIVWVCIEVLRVIPFVGWVIVALLSVALFIVWIMCIVKASQGSYLKLPFVSDFAARQSGYRPGLL